LAQESDCSNLPEHRPAYRTFISVSLCSAAAAAAA